MKKFSELLTFALAERGYCFNDSCKRFKLACIFDFYFVKGQITHDDLDFLYLVINYGKV